MKDTASSRSRQHYIDTGEYLEMDVEQLLTVAGESLAALNVRFQGATPPLDGETEAEWHLTCDSFDSVAAEVRAMIEEDECKSTE